MKYKYWLMIAVVVALVSPAAARSETYLAMVRMQDCGYHLNYSIRLELPSMVYRFGPRQ
jgi:hypothetical protein